MKKLVMSLALLLVTLCCTAQPMQKLPTDPQVKVGKLDNGLTYYIRHNEEPKGQADFFIAQKVGSMQEEDNQAGLAHFLEHMCFNGTTHFPGKAIIEYLESIGVKFGYNLNAYTSFDETVYNISSVPVSRDGIVDSCLLILHDWSHDLLLEDKEIDAERGVIHEEWRGSGAQRRMLTTVLPTMYPGCRYGQRMPIGTMEVVDNFPYQLIRDYYHTWYRPDLQAIVVVGDLDVDAVEAKIKSTFADITLPQNRTERVYEPVADNAEPIVAIASDKETTTNNAMVMFKSDCLPAELRNTTQEYVMNYLTSMVTSMLNSRLAELLQTPQPPFIQAGAGYGDYFVSQTKDAFSLDVYYADGGFEPAFKAVVREWKRARDFGFTQGEYDRARAEYLRSYEKAFEDRAKTTSTTYARECCRNFTQQEPMPGIEIEYQLVQALAPQIPLEGVNSLLPQLQVDTNLVVVLLNTETEKKYTPAEVLETFYTVMAEELEPYVDKVSGEPIMAEEPQGGSIKAEKPGKYGTTVVTLSNGVRVVLKNTDFKKDEILFYGVRAGGTSLFDNDQLMQVSFINEVHSAMGLGAFSATDLDKALAGKVASAHARVGNEAEVVRGNCSPRDIRTMLQLAYLQFSGQRMDADAFESFRTRNKQVLEKKEANPAAVFSDSLRMTLNDHNARLLLVKPEMMDELDMNVIRDMYESRFNHADGFTFYLVGNLEGDSVKQMVATYLGALPVDGSKNKWVDRKVTYAKGKVENLFSRPMTQDKGTTVVVTTGAVPYNLKNMILMDCIEQELDNMALTRMREEIGATYSPGVQCNISRSQGRDQALMLIYFECDPAQVATLRRIAEECFDNIAANGPSQETVDKTKQYLLKNYAAAQTQNNYWLNLLDELDWHGLDTHKDYEKLVKSFTAKDVQKLAQKLISQGNRATISMTPEK